MIKKEKTSSQELIQWGFISIFSPLIGIISIFVGWIILHLFLNIIGGVTYGPEDHISTIVLLIKGILTLGGFIFTFWALIGLPLGIILVIIGGGKRIKK